MKITDATVIVCSPGRNFVTLKLTTQDGITGIGDATVNGRELAVASYLQEHVCPVLIGRDARNIEDTWNYLYKGAYWRRGPITMAAVAAVDMALWDIKGKALGVPVYQLLGGQSRNDVMVYTHAAGRTVDDVCQKVADVQSRGFKAIRAQAMVPGLKLNYGVAATQDPTDTSMRPLPLEEDWSSERYLNFVPKLFARLRKECGEDLHLLHDIHHRLTPIEAARLGKELEPYHLFWLEDPTPAEVQENLRLMRHHTTTPIAIGEVFNTIFDCYKLIEEQLIDYIRTTAVHAGGLTHQKKIAALAELHQVRTACHGAQDMSPICLAANLHFGLSVHNFGIQEYSPHSQETERVFPHAYNYADGAMHPGDKPGLGVEFDESLASTFPYQRSYLPVTRKLDGTLHDW